MGQVQGGCGRHLRPLGLTPLLKLDKLTKLAGRPAFELFGKAEFMNPSGSLKDRILLKIIQDGVESGKLRPGMTIVESTTGNTGISTAMLGAHLGFHVLIIMPEGMSEERMKAIRAFGAKIMTAPRAESDVDLAVKQVKELVTLDPEHYFWVDQFNNPTNVQAHYETTGPEIWEQTRGRLNAFVAAVGTGGTLTGVGRYLKEQDPNIKVYAVEPVECPVLSKQRWGTHRIEGVGDGFVPSILDLSLLDGVITVSSERAIWTTKRIARDEGLFVGISSGANVDASLRLNEKHPELTRIVTMLNDHGFRYFSTLLFGEMKEIRVPERLHTLELTPHQRELLTKIEVIEE
ncbi:MAG: cysteine synthase family protein [Hadesarchaea archaeon]|nr:cysteine synthase family protein [Hadesarchaea archaeon]